MKKLNLFILLVSIALLSSCGGNSEKKKALTRIAECEAKIFGDSAATAANESTGLEMIQAYTDYANSWPKDSISADYLFRAAEIAMNLNKSGMAIEYYNRILLNYPEYSKLPYCVFLQAFILENQMGQYDQAKARYQEFLDKYPDHVLAKDARASIDNIGKPIEELIRQWEGKAGQ